ncbi:uncharacterized protein LOC117152573 [Bombus impatiens]|uniref:Uncharacterized protein LOC117152573 n=1 Tax=Bombus impatiens TaxID=132113 RepID=A0A6P8M1U6_BOMIM|nr:uncharacterized protein LOC117152573 [Bombus impatiens]
MNRTDKSTAKQNELIATIFEQLQSLAHEFRNFGSNIEQNINKIKEFTETSDKNRAKEIRAAAYDSTITTTRHQLTPDNGSAVVSALGVKYDTETDQPQISTHLKTGAENVTDDGTDGPDALQRPRISHVTIRQRNDCGKQQGLQAGEAIRTIETLRGQDDVGVEDFISPQTISTNYCRNKLKNLKQGTTESVQSFNSRFRRQLNELNYAVQHENREPIERRVALDIDEREAVKTYLLNLRYEIGQVLLASDPKNLNLAQQLAADKEQWLREANRVSHRPKNQFNNTTHVFKRSATNLQPQTFSRPSSDRMKLNCSKCSRIGHTAEMCSLEIFHSATKERPHLE